MTPARHMHAQLFSRLPDEFRHCGPASTWAAMTRPGEGMHSFLEGPSWGVGGDLWLADVAYGKLFTLARNGTWTLRHHYDGEPHAAKYIDETLVIVPDYNKGLLAFNPTNQTLTPLGGAETFSQFTGLSDIALSGGHYWLTDSGRSSLSVPYGQLIKGEIGHRPKVILKHLPYPNGVALSADGKTVFVAMTRDNSIWKLKTNGPETPPMVGRFITLSGGLGPDGLSVSSHGYLAIAQAQAGRAYIYDPLGDLVARIDTPGGTSTTSVIFDDDDNLFIIEAQQAAVFVCTKENWNGE